MLIHLSITSIFLAIFVLFSNIKQIDTSNSIRLSELDLQNNTIFQIDPYGAFFLYANISSMKYAEEGIITFNFPKEIFHLKLISKITSKVEHVKDNILNYFPIPLSASIFEYEVAVERRRNPAFESVLHIYFNKTINQHSNVYLLINLEFFPEIDHYYQKTFTVSPISLIEDKTFFPYFGKVEYYRPIKPFVPIFFSFELTAKYKYENVFIYCKENIMTVYYDHLVENNNINKVFLFTQIVSSDQYYLNTEENMQRKKFIMKFMTNEKTKIDLTIGYMRNPLILWKSVLTIRSYPIEITKQNQIVFMVGLRSQLAHNEYYMHIDHIYGKYDVHYSASFNPNYLMNKHHLLKNPKAFKQITDTIAIESEENFVQIGCSSPCRLNVIFFTEHRLNTLYTSGIFYFIFHRQYQEKIAVYGLEEFNIQIEILNQEDTLTINYLDHTVKLDNKNKKNKMSALLQGANKEKNIPFYFKAGAGAHIRILLHQDYQYHDVRLGKSEYFYENIVFKLERNMDIDYYCIEIELKEKDLPNYYYEYYGIGDDSKIPFPYFKTITIRERKVITLSNPYNKINSKISLADNEFYYYEIKAFEDNTSSFTVNYIQIKKENHPILKLNTPIFIELNSNSKSKSNLIQNLSSDHYLILQFFKCSNSKLQYQLYFNGKDYKQNEIMRKRSTFTSENYYVDYSIDFIGDNENSNDRSSFIFSYSYCGSELLEDLLEVKNETIWYIKESSSSIRLQWNAYLNNVKGQVYMIYVNEYNMNDNNCSFILQKPYDTVYSPKVIKESLMSYTIKDLKRGVYRMNVIAQENNAFNFTQIYDEVIVTIEEGKLISNIMIIISVILGISSIYLYCFSRTITYKRSYLNKGR